MLSVIGGWFIIHNINLINVWIHFNNWNLRWNTDSSSLFLSTVETIPRKRCNNGGMSIFTPIRGEWKERKVFKIRLEEFPLMVTIVDVATEVGLSRCTCVTKKKYLCPNRPLVECMHYGWNKPPFTQRRLYEILFWKHGLELKYLSLLYQAIIPQLLALL